MFFFKNFELSIIFFFKGEETNIPTLFVKSIRLTMGQGINIIQLSDFSTPQIKGVTEIFRYQISESLMLGRIEAYSYYVPTTKYSFFCDTDCLMIGQIKLPFSFNNIYLTKRSDDFKLNANFPEFYPEFVDKNIMELMPFIGGAIGIKGKTSSFFNNFLKTYKELPERFHRWYGDQYSLKLMVDKKLINYKSISEKIYLKTQKINLSTNQLNSLIIDGTKILHFKGPGSKKFMPKSYEILERYYKSR